MNHEKKQNSTSYDYMLEEEDISLLNFLLVLLKHKKMVLSCVLATFILTLGVTFVLPNIYSASVKILSPINEAPLYVSMLKSRTVADAIIEKFGLREVYRQKSQSKLYQDLESHVNISTEKKNGIIKISVEDENPKRAAEMANNFVVELQKLADRVYLSQSAEQLQFLEKRLKVVGSEMEQAEQRISSFKKNNAFRFDDQAKVAIDTIAGLNDELDRKRIELGEVLSYQKEQTPQDSGHWGNVQLMDQERVPGQDLVEEKSVGDIAVGNAAVPELGLRYGMLLRDFRMQADRFDFLSREHEEVEIAEAKSKPNIQVLDSAFVPDKKSKPKRIFIVLVATFSVMFFAILAAFIREYIGSISEEDRNTWQEIKGQVRFNR